MYAAAPGGKKSKVEFEAVVARVWRQLFGLSQPHVVVRRGAKQGEEVAPRAVGAGEGWGMRRAARERREPWRGRAARGAHPLVKTRGGAVGVVDAVLRVRIDGLGVPLDGARVVLRLEELVSLGLESGRVGGTHGVDRRGVRERAVGGVGVNNRLRIRRRVVQ